MVDRTYLQNLHPHPLGQTLLSGTLRKKEWEKKKAKCGNVSSGNEIVEEFFFKGV